MPSAHIGVFRGAALYIGALIGPGLLLVPALAVAVAGPASVLAWIGLLILSAPLAATFVALAVRYPVAGGVSAYVQAGLGEGAAAVTGGWFLAAIFLGAPAVSMMGGYYVSDLTGLGSGLAVGVAFGMFGTVLLTNALGLHVSSTAQLLLSSALVVVLAVAIALAIPRRAGSWTPFSPHGWWAVGTAANILVWLFVGWEAVAQLAGGFRFPAVDLPRAAALAFAVVTALYISLAIATVGISGSSPSRVPLADLISVGFGRAGRNATAVLAVVLTMGTMNVYMAGGAKLARALGLVGAAPRWLSLGSESSTLRPLGLFAFVGTALLIAVAVGWLGVTDLIRATSSLFIGVYVLAVAAAVRILKGRARVTALAALPMVVLIALFSGWYAMVPMVTAALSLGQWAFHRWRSRTRASALTAASIADSWRRP